MTKPLQMEMENGSNTTREPFLPPSSPTEAQPNGIIHSGGKWGRRLEYFKTLANLIKCLIGTGILALPLAYYHAGFATALTLSAIIAMANVHCMHVLVQCNLKLTAASDRSCLDYAEVFEEALKQGPKRFRRYSLWGRYLVNSFIMVTQIGICSVYLVFVADNIENVINYHFHPHPFTVAVYLVFLLVPTMLLCSIRDLHHLAPFSFIANIIYLVGLVIIFRYLFYSELKPISELEQFHSWSTLPLFFGAFMFSFEAICLVLPLVNKMENPRDFTSNFGVLNVGAGIALVLYVTLGLFGYLQYGECAKGSITLNLPNREKLAQSVKILLSVAVFFTYAVQFYVPMEVIISRIEAKIALTSPKKALALEYATRYVLILLTFGLAELIPHLDLIISLVGSVTMSFLGIIFPVTIELLTLNRNYGRCRWVLIKDILVLIFGLLGFFAGSYSSLSEIFQKFGSSADDNVFVVNNATNVCDVDMYNSTHFY